MTSALLLAVSLAALPESLTLDEALALGRQHRPALRQVRAQVEAAEARARQSLAPLLPTVSLGLGYSRSTANFVARPGAVPTNIDTTASASLNSFDYFSGNLTASWTAWDFGERWFRYQAALSTAQAQAAQENSQRRTSDYAVRAAFFAAVSQKALVGVAQVALDNTQARLAQVEGFVKVGARPEIDLAQVRADVANAKVTLLSAKNGYAVARARLNQAMGIEAPPTYEVRGDELPRVEGEAKEVAGLLDEALGSRPEAAALEAQVRAQAFSLRSIRGTYWPSLGLSLGGTLASRQFPTFVPNLNLQVSLNWAFYEGGVTVAQEREGEAALRQLEAQRDGLRLDVRLELEQALLDVAAARETVAAAAEVVTAAQEKLRLAEGRYKAGAGSALELSDAQVSSTQAAAQEIQARYALATARAALLAALGR